MDELDWLQNWYRSQCDGDWEHGYEVHIEPLDNPGWSVHINLKGTSSEGLTREKLSIGSGDNDWMVCWIANERFEGRGDAMKLKSIIGVFREWVGTESPMA